jgi:hypothetical protein
MIPVAAKQGSTELRCSAVIGSDERGREILTFHPGTTAWELGSVFPSDEERTRLGEVIRQLHEMLRDFRASDDHLWSDRGSDP